MEGIEIVRKTEELRRLEIVLGIEDPWRKRRMVHQERGRQQREEALIEGKTVEIPEIAEEGDEKS